MINGSLIIAAAEAVTETEGHFAVSSVNWYLVFAILVGGALASFVVGFFSRKLGFAASIVAVVAMSAVFAWVGFSVSGYLVLGLGVGLFGATVGVLGLPRDLLISTFAAYTFLGGVLTLMNGGRWEPPPPVEEAPVLELIEMPVIPPEEPDPSEIAEATEAAPTYTPMLADVPTSVSVMDFVQPMQPPPPPNTPVVAGTITIPERRTNIGTSLGAIFNLGDLDQIPVATFQLPPTYPYEMKRAGINGSVVVGFIVDTKGDVRDAYVVSSSHSEFEAAALAAIQKWKFRPGRRKGAPVNTRMQQPLSFKLTDSR